VTDVAQNDPPPCPWCGADSTLLCDGRLLGKGTCDAPICSSCATRSGSGIVCSRGRKVKGKRKGCESFTIDHCPFCALGLGLLPRDQHETQRQAHADAALAKVLT